MSKGIPTYSLNAFKHTNADNKPYQIEVFDANRHFEVEYPHRHDFFEVLFLTEGSGLHLIDQHEYTIDPPCIFFLSPGQTHNVDLSTDIKGYIFLFSAEFYLIDKSNKNQLLEFPFFFTTNQQNDPLQIPKEDLGLLQALFHAQSVKMNSKENADNTVRASLDLILNLCEDLFPKNNPILSENHAGHILVKRFRQMIEEKYQENPSIQQYADWLNVSPNHLTQVVKTVIGKTSSQLIKERVIIEIKRFLRYSDWTIQEIAEHLNFQDQSYFTKFFKKQTGITPNEYRK